MFGMAVSEKLKRAIIRTCVKSIEFDEKSKSFELLKKTHSDNEWKELEEVAKSDGFSAVQLQAIVTTTLNDGTLFEPKIEEKNKLDLHTVKKGQHLVIWEHNEVEGTAKLELLYIGENSCFVLSHQRHVLQFEDILKPISSPWNAGYKADFEVFRDEKRFPDESSIYRTGEITKIGLIYPPEVYDYLDDTEEVKTGIEQEETVDVKVELQ